MVKIKGKIKKYGFLVVACLMLATCVMSGTMAKYYSTGNASGLQVTVAKWDVQAADVKLGGSETINLSSLGWTIEPYGEGVTAKPVDVDGDDVENTIAPGTWGYAPINITNQSDVDAVVKITETGTFLPSESEGSLSSPGLKFGFMVSTDPAGVPDSPDTDWIADLSDIDEDDLGGIGVPAGGTTVLYVCYKWDFGGNVDEDNALGELADGEDVADTFTFGTLTISAEQAKTAVTAD